MATLRQQMAAMQRRNTTTKTTNPANVNAMRSADRTPPANTAKKQQPVANGYGADGGTSGKRAYSSGSATGGAGQMMARESRLTETHRKPYTTPVAEGRSRPTPRTSHKGGKF